MISKYSLLDLAVMAALAIAASGTTKHFLSFDHGTSSFAPAPHNDVDEWDVATNETNQTCLSSTMSQQEFEPVNESAVPSDEESNDDSLSSDNPSSDHNPSSEPKDDSSHHNLKAGAIVELYTDTSYFAIPAIITDPASDSKFSILNVMTNERHSQVDPSYVHPYQAYEDGTRASCNVGSLRSVYMTPCAISSHTTRESSGLVLYEVSYLNQQEELVRAQLPFSRVQRIHGRRNGHRIS